MAFTGQSTGRGSGTGWFDMNGQMTEIGYYHVSPRAVLVTLSVACCFYTISVLFLTAHEPNENVILYHIAC